MKEPPKTKSIDQVIIELQAFPELAAVVEQDRDWLWLPVDLRGAHNEAIRTAIGREGIGFQFAPKGHPLPSGKVAHWGHHCEKPIKFTRKGGKKPAQGESSGAESDTTFTDDQLLAALQ